MAERKGVRWTKGSLESMDLKGNKLLGPLSMNAPLRKPCGADSLADTETYYRVTTQDMTPPDDNSSNYYALDTSLIVAFCLKVWPVPIVYSKLPSPHYSEALSMFPGS